ncbi:MAG: restriction endonuclease subunit S [Bacteroidaceae bacterium]|nr:restriction endonuclease subunit S [Bacteroidaceae bacterium]
MIGSELPKGWNIQPLKEVVTSTKGKKPKQLSELPFDNSIPYIDIKALEKDLIEQYADVESSKSFSPNDIAVVWDGARCGWVSKSKEGAIGSTICALTPKNNIESNYLYYFLLSKYSLVNTKGRGVGIPHIDPTLFWNMEVPIPLPKEQKQISEKLNKLFGQIESTKKSTERIPELLKNFRQQILTYAVTGKLTGEDYSLWELKTLNEIAIPKAGYAFKATDFIDNGIQVIRMGNLYDNKLSLDRSPVFIPKNYDTDIIERSKVRRNDILITLTGTKYKRDYGYAIKIDSDEVLLLNQRILSLTPLINPDYLLLALRGDEFRNQFFEFETGGVNQGNVGVKNVMTIKLHIPSSKIQEEIVKRTHTLFDILDDVEKRYKTLCDKLDKLPQTILCKAFKGGLL